MRIKQLWYRIKDVGEVVLGALVLGLFVFGLGSEVVEGITYRNEPVYLISRMHDPIWKKAGFIPASIVCSSPARCEPSGKPSEQYFVLLGEHEVRQWGLDPSREIPVTSRNPYL